MTVSYYDASFLSKDRVVIRVAATHSMQVLDRELKCNRYHKSHEQDMHANAMLS